ncbi:hypothetical protein OEV98_15060 [Caldibacillus lycopersici]|uniref:Uncharacterized protein n=1 Tax=Perspicuibacillus lycopersici TaxID=1325689 RepID=A0AAE3LPE2_9BACI|nr:hypothetical protein [Perspicuibacillus lycopersici]MCU9614862.1 hypothetical protein [Perspicuibacillus lycopersici]
MVQALDEFYRYQDSYEQQADYTYSNRQSVAYKCTVIIMLLIAAAFVVFMIGVAIARFMEMQIIPGLLVLLYAGIICAAFGYFAYRFYKLLLHEATFQLREDGFFYKIKNRKTLELRSFFLPFREMESVTMGRYLLLDKPSKYGRSTYFVGVDFAMKGKTDAGEWIVVHFGMKDIEEIRRWIARYQAQQIPLYFTNVALKNLTVAGYNALEKFPYLYETSNWPLTDKKIEKELPKNWDGKNPIYSDLPTK